jgi:GrpB-like predicted nucleotidyltransferase (UPF0157 family)
MKLIFALGNSFYIINISARRFKRGLNTMRKVEVFSYNEIWEQIFINEAKILKTIFGNQLAAIHHIGSTSVPALKAKPIIDIMPIVKDIKIVNSFNEKMIQHEYNPKGENGITGRRYFEKGGDNRTHHVHIYQDGRDEIKRHLVFRDYLRTHPEAAKQYGELKEELAQKFPYNTQSYSSGKEQFVRETEEKALEWYRREQIKTY